MTRLPISILALAAAAGLSAGAALAQDFDLDALIAAAQAEPPLQIVDSTGKIKEMADAFAAKYGLEATGQKMKAEAQVEMFIREAQSGNVQGDVAILSDAPAVMAQLIPTGFGVSWVPPDLADKIPEGYRDPLVVVSSADVWTYNTELYDACPVDNFWTLTEPEWRGKVALQDPLNKGSYANWFNQMEAHGDALMAAAYEARYGKALDTSTESATAQWVKALAANAPLLGSSDSAAAEAVGAPGQQEGFMGFISVAKYRENDASGFKLGICTGMAPWAGYTTANVGVIAAGTDSPNAARLFLRYALTAEGIAPQSEDGKRSSNVDVSLPDDEPSGVEHVLDQLLHYDVSTALDDWDTRQDWQDLWRMNYRR